MFIGPGARAERAIARPPALPLRPDASRRLRLEHEIE